MKKVLFLAILTLGAAAPRAVASTIDFESLSDPLNPAAFINAGPVQTRVFNVGVPNVTVTFNGGVILERETQANANNSVVYATASILGADPSLLNPITIDFSSPVAAFEVDILNAVVGFYRIFDNDGHETNFFMPLQGDASLHQTLAGGGTKVSIQYLGLTLNAANELGIQDIDPILFDFAIDNVQITQAGEVPEPGTMLLFGTGIAALAVRRRMTRS